MNLPNNGYNNSYNYNYDFQQPLYDQLYWQNNGMGGFVNGQGMPLSLPPPPFYFPYSYNVPMGTDNNNYGQRQTPYHKRKRKYNKSKTPPPTRGILKSTKSPTDRRLVHFMPEGWQNPTNQTNNNTNKTTVANNRRQTVKLPDNQQQQQRQQDQQNKPKKSPDKAHRDTLLRRQRRQKSRVAHLEQSKDLGRLNDNRFFLLSDTDESDEQGKNEIDGSEVVDKAATMNNNNNNNNNNNKQKAKQQNNNKKTKDTTTEVLPNEKHVVENRSRLRQKKTQNTSESQSDDLDEFNDILTNINDKDKSDNEIERSSNTSKDKHKMKIYLQDFKIFSYLKDRLSKCRSVKVDHNEIYTYAKNTIEAYDKWVNNHYEVQVWQRFHTLGTRKDHWAKEIVDITHTREAKENITLCEKKITHFTSACVDANNIIELHMKKITATVAQKIHDLMLDYIKEATNSMARMSTNRIQRANAEKDEWIALKAFEKVATEQQKTYATCYCKPVLKIYQRKKKRLEVVSAHVTYNIIPKIISKCDINIPIDRTSLSSEQSKAHKEALLKLSRDFRLQATELYVGIAKAEFDFQQERLDELLYDFPADRVEIPQTQMITNEPSEKDVQIDDEDENEHEMNVFTQKTPSSEKQKEEPNDQPSSKLYSKYIELALKRNLLETEKEILFLAENSATEAPFVLQVARDVTPVLRKDFVLQA